MLVCCLFYPLPHLSVRRSLQQHGPHDARNVRNVWNGSGTAAGSGMPNICCYLFTVCCLFHPLPQAVVPYNNTAPMMPGMSGMVQGQQQVTGRLNVHCYLLVMN